jgi:hypothetical protein
VLTKGKLLSECSFSKSTKRSVRPQARIHAATLSGQLSAYLMAAMADDVEQIMDAMDGAGAAIVSF